MARFDAPTPCPAEKKQKCGGVPISGRQGGAIGEIIAKRAMPTTSCLCSHHFKIAAVGNGANLGDTLGELHNRGRLNKLDLCYISIYSHKEVAPLI